MNVGTRKHAVILILSLLCWPLTCSLDIWNFHQAFFVFSWHEIQKEKKNLSNGCAVVQPWNVLCPCVQVWSRMPATCATMPAAAGTTWGPTWTGTTPRDVTSATCAAKSSNPKSHWKATDWATRTKVRVSLMTRFFLFALFWNSKCCLMCILNVNTLFLFFLAAQENGSSVQNVTSPQSPGRLCSGTWSSTLSLRYSVNWNKCQQELV